MVEYPIKLNKLIKEVLSRTIQYCVDTRNMKTDKPDKKNPIAVVHFLPKPVVARYEEISVPGIPKNVWANIVP